ncbi:hypothetical protein G7Y89_g2345 [Cudoniella acicularis]|uniref:Uncharacterized protein n=1 Tax=Cudoniella acicularis TaxID=354080 RepID=A0A8H4W9F4_9HELO|nr:hypothetical protein G7Y89_g2345 [Cudoniella acicularis]
MKSTIFAIGALLSLTNGRAFALPDTSSGTTSSTPFHDCLDSGKDWAECHLAISALTKRDTISSTPFHDCLDAGKSWGDCHLAVNTNHDLKTRDLIVAGKRGINFEGGVSSTNVNNIGGTEQCYSVNNLGGTGWLTNTAVEALKAEACSFAVDQALKAGGLGKFTTSKSGFYQGNGGPIVKSGVKFFLSTIFQGDSANIADLAGKIVDLHALGNDLCQKGIDHLTGDKGCTAPRRAAGRVEHTSVNGGEFNWALNGATALFDNAGLCTNCILSMVMEAANMVDKDGKTATPIDS